MHSTSCLDFFLHFPSSAFFPPSSFLLGLLHSLSFFHQPNACLSSSSYSSSLPSPLSSFLGFVSRSFHFLLLTLLSCPFFLTLSLPHQPFLPAFGVHSEESESTRSPAEQGISKYFPPSNTSARLTKGREGSRLWRASSCLISAESCRSKAFFQKRVKGLRYDAYLSRVSSLSLYRDDLLQWRQSCW